MPGTIRFSRAINLSHLSGEAQTDHSSLLDLVKSAKQQGVSFLPISPQAGLGIVGRGLSGDLNQSTADVATTLTFKNGIPSRQPRDNVHTQDWYGLTTELSILQHPPVRQSPHIVDLVGISWQVDPRRLIAWPYLVTPKVNRGTLDDLLTQDSIEEGTRFEICMQIAKALALLHSCGIGHGDLKPDNILLDEVDDMSLCAKVTDFGSSATRDQLRMPEGTPPWSAPELQCGQRHNVSAEDIIVSDLYSFGLIAAHLLLSKADLVRTDIFLVEPTRTTVQTLKDIQRRELLEQTLMFIANASDMEPLHLQVLEMIIDGTLVSEPGLRKLDWKRLLELTKRDHPISEENWTPLKPPQTASSFQSPTDCVHESFDVLAALGELDDVDYVLRINLAEDLKHKASSASCPECSRRYAFQLSICHRIGFGVARDLQKSRSWLETATMAEDTAKSMIARLSEEYSLTGRLTDQVRENLAIGVLVTTDRTQQYQIQGRILDAEKSLSAEILARELELGLFHVCLSKLKSDLAQIYKIQGRAREAKIVQGDVVSILAHKFGDMHPSVLAAKAAMASILTEEGLLLEAEESQRQLQPMFEKVLGKEHPETIIALQNWAVTLHSQSRYHEAAKIFTEISEARAKTLTEGHPLTIQANICLVSALHGKGSVKEANELMARIVQRLSKVEDPVIEAHIQMNLAILCGDQNRLEEAEVAAKSAVNLLCRRLEKDDPLRLNTEEVLSIIHGKQGKLKEQEVLLRRILESKAVLDKRSPSLSNTRTFLASNLLRQGRADEAGLEAQKVLENLKDSFGLDPENLLACTELLAMVRARNGKIEQAQDLRFELLASCEKVLGTSHRLTLQARSCLAGFYNDQGFFDKAIILEEKNLNILQDAEEFGTLAIQTARELAGAYREQSRFQDALDICRKALLWCEKSVGPDHVESLAICNSMAGVYLNLGLLSEAQDLLESSVIPGSVNTDLEVYAVEKLGEVRMAQGQVEDSVRLARKALDLSLQRRGLSHPETIKMAGNMLGSRLREEDLTPGLELEVLENLRMKREIIGPTHFSTIKTLTDLAYAYGEQGRLRDAKELYDSIEAGGGEKVNLQNALRYATYLAKRADLAFRSGQLAHAQELEEEALAIRRRLLPPEHNAVLVSMMNVASTMNKRGMHDGAEGLLRQVVILREQHLPPNAAPTLSVKNDLAAVLFFKGELAESEALYAAVVAALKQKNDGPVALARRTVEADLLHVREALAAQVQEKT